MRLEIEGVQARLSCCGHDCVVLFGSPSNQPTHTAAPTQPLLPFSHLPLMAFRSFTVLSVLIIISAAALAQVFSSSQPLFANNSPSSQSNPYIPSGISTTCADYLTSLNNDTSFAACTQSLTSVLAQFAPGASTSAVTSSATTTTLQSLCKNNPPISCSQSTVTAQLSAFYAACSHELTSTPNQSVKTTYDSMYGLIPFSQAVCSKDDNGNYCAAKLSNTTSTTSIGNVALAESPQTLLRNYLYTTSGTPTRRGLTNATAALVPNTTTFQNTNLVFLFLDPNADANQLCQTCTRAILTPYITFESTAPYAPGLSQSLLFAGQTNLYNNITSKCTAGFLSGAVAAAGGLSGSIVGSGALRLDSQELSVAVSAILGVAALIAASF